MKLFKKHTLLYISLSVSTSLLAQHDGHEEEEIIDLQQLNITASPFILKQEDVVIPTNTLPKSELRRTGQASLGATLDGLPGIHNSNFTAGAGRPIIRGFDGDRLSILQNGTDTFDASFSSPDHGVSVEPLLIDKVEIVRGPSSLLYGNAAIGGVVNVIDKSMLRTPIEGVIGEAEIRYGSVADETAGGLSFMTGSDNFAWSLGYFKREASDYDIPGFAESLYQRDSEGHDDEHGDDHDEEHEDEHEDEHHEEHEDEHEEDVGILRDSFVETETLALGVAWFGESATYNLAFNAFDSFYGVPGHTHAHDHGHDEEEGEEHEEGEDHGEEDHHDEDEEGSVFIELENRRTAFRAEWVDIGGFFESIELDATYGDYQHIEVEGAPGEQFVGTKYERSGYDLRLTGIHQNIGDWSGALGVDLKDEAFEAVGEEAFIPANDKRNQALFAVERMDATWGAAEIGVRLERQTLDPDKVILEKISETTANFSAGLVWRFQENETFAVNASLNQRAPNATELYAFGPHVGTGTFEVGNLLLDKEKSKNLNASWRKSVGFVTGEFTLFYSDFSDYIFLEHMDHEEFEALFAGEDDGGLDIVRATAVDAEFYGYELDLRFHIVDSIDQRFHFDLTIDQTRATNQSEGSNLPRIPTRRIGGRFEYEDGPWRFGLGARYHTKARHLAPEESPSDSYSLVFADINYHWDIGENAVEFFAVGRNLSDEEARPHTSFNKDRVPLPGRSVEFGARVFF